ncbi:hypothetical protein KY284_010182 [Solanum tuberosum]|nr:hypothetical protein KY284_010182 [Solanum tuberosum]
MFLPRFSGNDNGNPKNWIFRAELYFTYLGFDEKDWLPLPSFYFDGEAFSWFDWLFCNKLLVDWNHFKDAFTQRFQQQTNINVLRRLANSSQVHYDYISSVPIVSQSVVVSPFPASSHFSRSSAIASTCNAESSQADQVFDKFSMKSVALIAENNMDIEPIEDIATPQFGNINLVEANFVNEPSSTTADHVFDKIPHLTVSSNICDMKAIVHDFEHSVSTVANVYNDSLCTETTVPLVVLHDTDISNNDEEKKSHDNVKLLFEKFPPLNTPDFSVAFACQGIVMSNASSLLAEIDYSFVIALWLRTIPCWHDSPEEYYGGTQNRWTICLDLRLRKCNWVDTGQECTSLGFLLSDICAYKNYDVLDFSLEGVIWLAPIMRHKTGSLGALPHSTSFVLDKFFSETEIFISTSDMYSVEVLLNAEHGTPTNGWDPRINFTFMALTGYTVNVAALQMQGCSGRYCLIAYSNSMPRVWDPGQSSYANSSILQPDSALSPNFTHFYIIERSLSFYPTTLTSKVAGLTWRRNILVFMLAWHAENKARYVRILETCSLKVIVFASFGTFLLWKDSSGLAPVAKDLCSFWSASIMLILSYFHRCKSEGLDTTKPLVSRSTFLVLTQLVFFFCGFGRAKLHYIFHSSFCGVNHWSGHFFTEAGNDLPTRNSVDVKIIVHLIVVWAAGTCPLFIPWYTTL